MQLVSFEARWDPRKRTPRINTRMGSSDTMQFLMEVVCADTRLSWQPIEEQNIRVFEKDGRLVGFNLIQIGGVTYLSSCVVNFDKEKNLCLDKSISYKDAIDKIKKGLSVIYNDYIRRQV